MELKERIAGAVALRATMGGPQDGPAGPAIDVGYGTDAAYVRPMGVSIVSLALHNPDLQLRCHVFASSIRDADVVCLEDLAAAYGNVRIFLYDVDAGVFADLPVLKRYPLPIYFRLMMPIVLADVARILYLDSDILCMGGLGPMLGEPLAGNIAAVVPDNPKTARKRLSALAMEGDAYFNSGVMLIDVAGWNAARITERTLALLSATPDRFQLPDQDALNLLLQGSAHFLSRDWNCLTLQPEDLMTVRLLHCAAHPKPWRLACDSPAQELYLGFERASPWKGEPLEPPADYQEARWYARALLRKGRILEGLGWHLRSAALKFERKVLRRK